MIIGMRGTPVPPEISSIEYSSLVVSLLKGWCAGVHPLITRAMTKEEYLVLVARDSRDVSTYLSMFDDNLEVDRFPYFGCVELTEGNKVSTVCGINLQRLLGGQKCRNNNPPLFLVKYHESIGFFPFQGANCSGSRLHGVWIGRSGTGANVACALFSHFRYVGGLATSVTPCYPLQGV